MSRPNSVTYHGTPAAGMTTPALERRVLEAERLEVADGLLPRPADGVVRRLERRPSAAAGRRLGRGSTALQPQRHGPARVGLAVIGSQRRQACQVPFGGDPGDEHELAVRVLRRRVGLVDADDQLAPEAAVRRTSRPELAARPEPAGVDDAAADERVGPDVEDVGEVRFDRDLDRQPDRAAGVVDDVDVLVDAARHGPVDADRPGRGGRRGRRRRGTRRSCTRSGPRRTGSGPS